MGHDRLFEIFLRMLEETNNLAEEASTLIRRVVDQYCFELQNCGEIPQAHLHELIADLEAEVVEMYRKKTYGCLSLRAYREKRLLQAS